ncbi:MAG TPA: 50S ribosomal protein L24 [Chloroflexota bacterium]|nr:50S ribosomal protein L24 [Chloroflexota bacterium]
MVQKIAKKRKMRPVLSVRRDDEVEVITGKDAGKRGKVTRVIPEKNRVVIEGVNMVKRHLRRQPGSLQAGIVDMPAPMDRSNVMIVCPACNEPTRVGHRILGDGSKVRVCRNCDEVLDRES